MLSLDAFSELAVCQNVFAARAPQRTLLGDLKSKDHYASWSKTCSLARAGFVGVCDKLATFFG